MSQASMTVNDVLAKGLDLYESGRVAAAGKVYESLVAQLPNMPEAHHNLAQVLLLMGDFDRGWEEFEWRWKGILDGDRKFPGEVWRGQNLTGKSIFLHGEQGLGDNLQFARYASLLGALGVKVFLGCPKGLAPLFSTLAHVDALVESGSTTPPFDFHCPLMSLPGVFETRAGQVPAEVPYLRAEPDRVVQWRARLSAYEGLKVGLCWKGNPKHRRDSIRSTDFSHVAQLLDVKGVTFFSLQIGMNDEERAQIPEGASFVDLASDLEKDAGVFAETAALMDALDVVVTVDTSVCHLAGALARPTWLLLPFVPDWRWLMNRDDSPWYPTMRLFRQKEIGDWHSVFDALRQELVSLVESK